MRFFDYSIPLIRSKDIYPELCTNREIWFVEWQIGKYRLYSNIYTGADQACLFWALFVLPIFCIGQFSCVDWTVQAIGWTVVSLIGVLAMVCSARKWAKEKGVSWLLYGWVILIMAGLTLTDLSIFLGWGQILINLCPLWLGLCAIGYLCTGLALHSRALVTTSLIHGLAIWLLPYVGGLQFLFTGIVMVLLLFLVAEFRWDMQLQNAAQQVTYGELQ